MLISKEVSISVWHQISASQAIVIISHMRPDGDAVGSVLGLGLALKELGKSVQMVLSDGVPSSLKFLPGSNLIKQRIKDQFDLLIVLDSSDVHRMSMGEELTGKPDINIDHHITNEQYAQKNIVIPEAVSTTEIIAQIILQNGLRFSTQVAENLLTGIITDTIGFRTTNMKPDALRLAADLVEAGANLPELYMKALNHKSFEALKFWGSGLSRLERDGEIVWSKLTITDRNLARYPGRDDADLINVLSTIDDAFVVILFVEQPNGMVKISWRSVPGYDVTKVASRYGGGGHPAASGAEVSGKLELICQEVVQVTKNILAMKN